MATFLQLRCDVCGGKIIPTEHQNSFVCIHCRGEQLLLLKDDEVVWAGSVRLNPVSDGIAELQSLADSLRQPLHTIDRRTTKIFRIVTEPKIKEIETQIMRLEAECTNIRQQYDDKVSSVSAAQKDRKKLVDVGKWTTAYVVVVLLFTNNFNLAVIFAVAAFVLWFFGGAFLSGYESQRKKIDSQYQPQLEQVRQQIKALSDEKAELEEI